VSAGNGQIPNQIPQLQTMPIFLRSKLERQLKQIGSVFSVINLKLFSLQTKFWSRTEKIL